MQRGREDRTGAAGDGKKMRSIYVCHTYYHVYVSILKEFAKPREEQEHATIVLSRMSNDFEDLKQRMEATGYFEEIIEYDEKPEEFFPELKKYRVKSSNFVKAMYNRICFTRRFAKLQAPYVPVDFRQYDAIYVFCDSDPVGFYLNQNRIYYHAVEDGLNTLKHCDLARVDNTPHFGIKTFFSKRLNLIFVQNGYGKYCLDMEVNDISVLKYPCPYRIEVSREELFQRLLPEEKQMLLRIFVKQEEKLRKALEQQGKPTLLILTEPLSSLEVRKKIFQDLKEKYEGEYEVIFKQHPRDLLDYEKEFPDNLLIDRTVPMEMLNFYGEGIFDMVVGVFTDLENVYFAKKKLRLGRDHMDAYEPREIHESRFESK